MKNFWLDRHQKRKKAKVVEAVAEATKRAIFKKFGIVVGKSPIFRRKP